MLRYLCSTLSHSLIAIDSYSKLRNLPNLHDISCARMTSFTMAAGGSIMDAHPSPARRKSNARGKGENTAGMVSDSGGVLYVIVML